MPVPGRSRGAQVSLPSLALPTLPACLASSAQSGQLQLTAVVFWAPRYALEPPEDTERIFDIDAQTGAILTRQALDRETAGWHNITVLAMEAGELAGGPGGGGCTEGLCERRSQAGASPGA